MDKEITDFQEEELSIDMVDTEAQLRLSLASILLRYDEKFIILDEFEKILIGLKKLITDGNELGLEDSLRIEQLRIQARTLITEGLTSTIKSYILKRLKNLCLQIEGDGLLVSGKLYQKVCGYIRRLELARLTTINNVAKQLGINARGTFGTSRSLRANNSGRGDVPVCSDRRQSNTRRLNDGGV